MAHLRWDALVRLELPQDLARLEVEAIEHPTVHLTGPDMATRITAHGRRRKFLLTHRGGHENLVAPHDGRRPAPAGNRHFPHDTLSRAPCLRQRRSLPEAVRVC